jgi:hypothetical protein
MINNSLDSLTDFFREEYVEPFLAELMQRRLYVVVVETRRTRARQEMLQQAGKSKTSWGFHCEGKAIDLAPVDLYSSDKVQQIDWRVSSPQWKEIGDVGKEHGLVWGGDWISFPDLGHFQEPGELKDPEMYSEEQWMERAANVFTVPFTSAPPIQPNYRMS